MLRDLENIKNYFVYQYEFLDDLSAIIDPYESKDDFNILEQNSKEILDQTIDEVKRLFHINGWEGDGHIGLIWVPPFIDIGYPEDTWGTYLWHVKQYNNGTSFIASPFKLDLKRLKNQNEIISHNHYRNMEPTNIIKPNVEVFLERIKEERISFEQAHSKLNAETDNVSKAILEKLLGYTQGDLIAKFNDFLNGCYLVVLLEVLQNGNRDKIKA